MKKFATVLDAMSNARRLQILTELLEGETSVNILASRMGLSQSSLSQHLSKLRTAKLVSTRRDAQTIYYSVDSPVVSQILATLEVAYGEPASVVIKPTIVSA